MSLPDYLVEASYAYKFDKIVATISGVNWQPDLANEPQRLAYELADKVDILGYGGQAGGGKTDLGLGLAGTKFRRSTFFRREYPQLEDVIERGDEIYPASFVGGAKKQWRFDNRIVSLGSMPLEKNWTKYQGRGKDLLVFDEAAEFLENQVRNLIGWNRSSIEGQHTLALLCFNPPTTPEGEWIVGWFAPWIDPEYSGERAASGEIRWFASTDDGEAFTEVENGDPFERDGKPVYPHSRTFISASRYDNPYLGEDYERKLDQLPEPLRSKVKDGDFTVGTADNAWQVIPTNWVLEAQARWKHEGKPDLKMRAMGVDVAHGGKDKTVLARLYGVHFELDIYPGVDTPRGKDTAQKVHVVMEAEKSDAPIAVDVIGYGASADDSLQDDYGYDTLSVNVGSASTKTDKSGKFGFRNLRAEIYWKVREALDPEGGENIALPDDRNLRVELCAARYKIVSGKYVIESKDDIKARLGHSPDLADAITLAWYAANVQNNMRIEVQPKQLRNYRG